MPRAHGHVAGDGGHGGVPVHVLERVPGVIAQAAGHQVGAEGFDPLKAGDPVVLLDGRLELDILGHRQDHRDPVGRADEMAGASRRMSTAPASR